jgi:hypothetical protein
MATRAINLKLLVSRKGERCEAKSLWVTHREVNLATRHYEQLLLALRQRAYLLGADQVAVATVTDAATKLANKAIQRNGKLPLADASEALALLQQLYQAMVPSSTGDKGSAQDAGGFVSPLIDPKSEGFASVFEKVANPPNWVSGVRDGLVDAFDAAYAWLDSSAGQQRLKATGAPPAWVRQVRKNDKLWPKAFVEDFDAKLEEAKGVPTLMRRLRELGLLPLFPAYFAPRIEGNRAAVSAWDRLAMRLAVGHLMSWESWCALAASDHARRIERVRGFRESQIDAAMQAAIERLQTYEKERTEELAKLPQFGENIDFRISERMVRGWEDLREKLLRKADSPTEELIDIIGREQGRLRGGFGDAHLFRWLVEPSNKSLWAGGAKDPVGLIARLNAMQRLAERSRETAVMTLPDPVEHPRSAQWEPKGGANLKNYTPRLGAKGKLEIDLPLLCAADDGKLVEKTFTFSLAPSGQLQQPELKPEDKKIGITYRHSSGETSQAALGSADLLMEWDYLRNRQLEIVEDGDIGPAFLKVALDVVPILPAGSDGRTPKAAFHFQTAAGKKSKHLEHVRPGLRVLSVDLGVRIFGSCSVFELRDRHDGGGLAYTLHDLGLVAVHERSFTLLLPGEDVGTKGRRWQEETDAELARLRRALARHRRLRALATLTTAELRAQALDDMVETMVDGAWPFEASLIAGLRLRLGDAEPTWEGHVAAASTAWRDAFAGIVSEWRSRTKSRQTHKWFGKSTWAIDHLSRVRRFLQSWSLIGRSSGEIRRSDRAKSGIFAAQLLDHINAIKEDRLKTGADLLVQAARGLVRDGQGVWVQKQGHCPVILFEDLSRYRMRTDRPRRENSQLMKWAHRGLLDEVRMQGELYGVSILDTGAAFSSRYHGRSGTPGIRVRTLAEKNLKDAFLLERIARENPGLDVATLTAGDIVPLSGGDTFCVMTKDGGRVLVNADINAAQNLQRRFWTRHGEAFRVVARGITVDGAQRWVPHQLGERLLGALGGYGQLVPTGHETGSCRWEKLAKVKWSRLAGVFAEESDEEGEDEIGAIVEEALERVGDVVVFFRDPSGVILPADLWYPSQTFWGITRQRTASALRRQS